jgi:hypothetical protein
MPARIASGNVGQASVSVAKAGSMAGFSASSAPLFAPPGAGFVEFSVELGVGSNPLGGIVVPRGESRGALSVILIHDKSAEGGPP